MVPMAAPKRLKRALYTGIMLLGVVLWLAALLLLTQTAQNSAEFGRLQDSILLANAAGVLILLAIIVGNFVRLVRDYRQHIPGSRLKARMVGLMVLLVVLPLVVVYGVAIQFLNRGIDSWFNVDVEQGMTGALELSQTALGLQMREVLENTQAMAVDLASLRGGDMIAELGVLRREVDARDASVFGANGRILGTSSQDPTAVVPRYPSDEVVFQLRQRRPYVSLEPQADGSFQIRTAVTVETITPTGGQRILEAVYDVDQQLSDLANNVEVAYNRYGELAFLRNVLKDSFTLSLSLVLLLALLSAVYGAFFLARRLVVPIQQLVAGTRAVAKGDFETRLPSGARDEIGFLINSFNDMTQRLARAREETRVSQQQVESERAQLSVVLARLTTGVVSLEPDLTIRTANQAAGAILGLDLESQVGKGLMGLAAENPLLQQLATVCEGHFNEGEGEWREQIVLHGEVGRRVLMCACTSLPADLDSPAGYVVVFDDITALMQAQRDAAWGEVARRLAHEIKNPLTPIQLSAERLRRKYLQDLEPNEMQLLDRATHTIIQQVEAMKEMVNAFSEYARAPEMEFSRFDLNELITEVTELYRHQDAGRHLELHLPIGAAELYADKGRLRQILHNLIRNGLEAIEGQADGRVEISSRPNMVSGSPALEITVSDNGPGFQTDRFEQVFDPYVTSKAKGTGLGLAIVKKMVEEHGGVISARNQEHGGAEVSIILPVSGEVTPTGLVQRRERA
jgi:nitrogen fixation/metabolism regulation signal transduction histidine kinase